MKKPSIALFSLLSGVALIGLTSCEVEKTEEGKMPKIEVTEEGNMPEYDVQGPKVETGTTEIEVPTIEITPADELPDEDPVDDMDIDQ